MKVRHGITVRYGVSEITVVRDGQGRGSIRSLSFSEMYMTISWIIEMQQIIDRIPLQRHYNRDQLHCL